MDSVAATPAASIDTTFLQRLRGGRFRGRVHSVFARVVNVEHDGGELFTLACRDVDNAPRTAVLELDGFGATGIAVGDAVSADASRMRVGDRLSVEWAGACAWQCALPAWPADRTTLRANLRRLNTSREPANAFEAAVAAQLEERSAQLVRACSHGDTAGACRIAQSLLGLGPGLTPSGDDFLVGLFAVLHIPGSPCQRWLGGGANVLALAAHSTHAISLAALTQAARGRVRESIAALIGHLMHGATERLATPLQRVLSIGSSSGADIVAGIRCGFELHLSREGTPPCP